MEAMPAANELFVNTAPSSEEGEGADLFECPTLGDTQDLPCGYLADGQLYRNVILEEITGVDEDMLANEKLGRDGSNLDHVIANCIAQIGPIENPMNPQTGVRTRKKDVLEVLRKLRVGDRYWMLVKLRTISHPQSTFEANISCPRCGEAQDMGVDLEKLKVHTMDDSLAMQQVYGGKTDKDVFKFKVATGADEKIMQRIRKEKKEELLTALLFVKLVELNGEKPSLKALKLMSSQRRNAIRKATLEIEGGIETALDAKCDNCGHGWKMELPVGQKGFFFPSGL